MKSGRNLGLVEILGRGSLAPGRNASLLRAVVRLARSVKAPLRRGRILMDVNATIKDIISVVVV